MGLQRWEGVDLCKRFYRSEELLKCKIPQGWLIFSLYSFFHDESVEIKPQRLVGNLFIS